MYEFKKMNQKKREIYNFGSLFDNLNFDKRLEKSQGLYLIIFQT